MHQIMQDLLLILLIIHYLKIWIPFVAVPDLKWCLIRWRFNQVMPKFPNSIEHLLKISMHCLNIPPPILVYHSKMLVVADNMQKHCNLLFYTAMYAVSKQIFSPKQIAKLKERSSPHAKHVYTLYIIAVIDFVQVLLSFLIHNTHWGISNTRSGQLTHSNPTDEKCIHSSD